MAWLRLNKTTAIGIAALATFANVNHVAAVDLNSTDYVPLPDGTNLFVSYSTYTMRNEFRASPGTFVDKNATLDSATEILRFIHYMDIGGITIAPQVLIPFGGLYNGKLSGAGLDDATGIGQPILAMQTFLINNPDTHTYFGVNSYTFLPLGSYRPGEALNLGENRWKFNPQAAFVQETLDKQFLLQVSGDAYIYGVNNDASAVGFGRLTQRDSYQLQTWLSYSPLFDQTWRFAVGYSQFWGGEQRLNGTPNGQATKSQQIRFEVSKFLEKDLQVLAEVSHDIKNMGGFKQDLVAMVRLVKAW
jgi:hypothetical protein